MRNSICGKALLVRAAALVVLALCGTTMQAQIASQPFNQVSFDVGTTFAVERAQIAPSTCNCFWLKGGGIDVALSAHNGLGIAAGVTGDAVSNYTPGVSVSKIAFVAGPRYTLVIRPVRMQIFGQGLFGRVSALDGAYPSTTGVKNTASSLEVMAGGGLNVVLSKHFGVRLLDAEYVYTQLPNSYANTQNDVRLGFGVTYHLSGASKH